MAFTDEDLKRVTDSYETLREMRARGVSEAETMSLTLPEWDSLLARLDAAERVCEFEAKYEIPDNTDWELSELLEAWRKAAGKSQ